MRHHGPLLLVLSLAAACGRGDAPATPGDATPAAAGSPAPAPPPSAPASTGTVTMTLRGQGVDVSGEGAARRCGDPAYLPPAPTKGVYYEGAVQGYTVAMGDMEARRAGAQQMLRAGGTGWEGTVNGPGASYAIEREPAPTIQVSDDFKTVEFRGKVKAIGSEGQLDLEATFRCP